jgi:Excreted virulence factor EspC, type VII ESX diderm
MADAIRIIPAVLAQVADGHEEVARTVDAARDRSADILAAVQSLGPIMHEVKAAVSDLLAERDAALTDHATRHRNVSTELRVASATYTQTDHENAGQIRQI